VLGLLVEKFESKPIGSVEGDLEAIFSSERSSDWAMGLHPPFLDIKSRQSNSSRRSP
jgi:hypothetical protein